MWQRARSSRCETLAFVTTRKTQPPPASTGAGSGNNYGNRLGNGVVSLATLSRHLGLSQAVISRVLNASPAARCIPQVTQERIFAAAREFHYRPNILARSLRRGRSMMIGVLVPEVSEGYATLVLAGLEQALLQAGYLFILISHHHRAEVVERSLSLLRERAVDGLVAIDTPFPYNGPLPMVTVSCANPHRAATNIVLDHRRAAELALSHLLALGHRRVAIIKGQAFSSDTEIRWGAICNAAARLGLPIDPGLVVQLEGEAPAHEPGYRATQQLLARSLNRNLPRPAAFTALFAFNDVSAIGAMRALREAHYRIPEDISVVGFDDIQSAGFQMPSLTTVRQPLEAMGILAGETVLKRVAANQPDGDPGAFPHDISVEPELILRESTGMPLRG